MIVFPILNFVLPLMYTSFLLVANPGLLCTECVNKSSLRVSESKKNEAIDQTDHAAIEADLTKKMHAGEFQLQMSAGKEE